MSRYKATSQDPNTRAKMGQSMDSDKEEIGGNIVTLPSPIRTQGDGMEHDVVTKTEVVKQPKNSLGNKLIYRPSDFNHYHTPAPPVIAGKIVNLVPKQALQYRKKPIGNMKSKEPRFVPYEPYKAAVNPLIPKERTKADKKPKNLDAEVPIPIIVDIEKLSIKEDSSSSVSKAWEAEKKAMESQISLLKDEKIQMEGQLKFHAQVNCDLKTLLVAAVGEDLEMRVQLLTEDKLQLARALLSSAQVCNTHEERTEFLAGQCEVWRSKFLASSLMLEDLAHRKATLVTHAAQLEDVTKKLLEERTAVWEKLTNTFRSLSVLRDGFAPGDHSQLPATASLLELSTGIESLSLALRGQLLIGKDVIEPSLAHISPDTATVQAARQLLGGAAGLATQDVVCNAVMGAAIAIATKQPMCCAHCSDHEVHTV